MKELEFQPGAQTESGVFDFGTYLKGMGCPYPEREIVTSNLWACYHNRKVMAGSLFFVLKYQIKQNTFTTLITLSC